MDKIFRNKKILITGHTGFKGSWLAFWLFHLGAKVFGISNGIKTNPSIYKILKIKSKISEKKINLKNFSKFRKAIFKHKPDFLFHLAAEAIVKHSYLKPKKTWETNTLGTINLLESLRKYKKKIIVVIVTSDKVYKNVELKRGYREEDQLGGFDPYSASKASADIAVQSYINSYFKEKKNIRIAIARAGNVIGGGDWSEGRLIPDCVRSWCLNKTVIIRNPESTRPWQHVFDVLRGYLILATNLKKNSKLNGEVFNFGPKLEKNRRVINLIEKISSVWTNTKWKVINKKKFYESKLLHLNSLKAKKKLKWKCELTFNQAIDYTVSWYKSYLTKNKSIIDYSLKQLRQYQKLTNLK